MSRYCRQLFLTQRNVPRNPTGSTVSEVVARIVAEHSIEVFALMGNGNAYFTDALARDGKVRMTGLRHEAGTVASADAYYRVNRKIAVATTTLGPSYTNTVTSLAEAVQSRTPLVYQFVALKFLLQVAKFLW